MCPTARRTKAPKYKAYWFFNDEEALAGESLNTYFSQMTARDTYACKTSSHARKKGTKKTEVITTEDTTPFPSGCRVASHLF